MMTTKTKDLAQIESLTLGHYQDHAEAFWRGTQDHDVTQNYAAFLAALPRDKVLEILDFGCGPGRDVHYFKSLGHRPVGLDGCAAFCTMARRLTHCEILQQRFLELDLIEDRFDGVFANASLFHVPARELPRVLTALHATLRTGGILFSSNPRGNDEEGWSGQRFGHFMTFESSRKYLEAAGFTVLDHYYRPKDRPFHEQPWLAIIAQSV